MGQRQQAACGGLPRKAPREEGRSGGQAVRTQTRRRRAGSGMLGLRGMRAGLRERLFRRRDDRKGRRGRQRLGRRRYGDRRRSRRQCFGRRRILLRRRYRRTRFRRRQRDLQRRHGQRHDRRQRDGREDRRQRESQFGPLRIGRRRDRGQRQETGKREKDLPRHARRSVRRRGFCGDDPQCREHQRRGCRRDHPERAGRDTGHCGARAQRTARRRRG